MITEKKMEGHCLLDFKEIQYELIFISELVKGFVIIKFDL